MIYQFGKLSKEHLYRVVDELKLVAFGALEFGVIDFAIIESIRPRAEQDKYFNQGKSCVQWPNSKHNIKIAGELSEAYDVVPVVNGKVSWRNEHCLVLAGVMLSSASANKVKLRWGGNWDMDGEPITDQTFQDLVHYEYIGDK